MTTTPELLLEGPTDALLRSLDALRQVCDPGFGASILELGLIESLRLSNGEAELRLVSPGPACPLSDLTADEAFRAIQQALPDTDIYLSHDHDVEWCPERASAALRRRLGWCAETP
jgi:metal-sulfur cluster biosynthetic enzyme